MDMRCTSLNNGISESFNRGILGPRHKPIITMLEEIRLCIMQRLVAMNKIAFSLEDKITPSIRKRLELLKDKQRGGRSGRKGDGSGGSGGRGDGSGGNSGFLAEWVDGRGKKFSRVGGSRRGSRMARTLTSDRHLTAKEMNMPLDLEEAPYVETTLTTVEIEEAPIEKGNTLVTVDKGNKHCGSVWRRNKL
ncbi:hypothetical protein Tco_1540023 [Tanacetum coccineum]